MTNVQKLAKALSEFYNALYDDEDFTGPAAFKLTATALPVFAKQIEVWEVAA